MATLGKTGIGAIGSAYGTNALAGTIFQAAQSGTVTDIQVYIAGSGNGPQNIRPVIYNASSSTVPTTLVAVGSESTVTTNQVAGWVTLTISAPIVSGNFYLIGLWLQSVGSSFKAQGKFDTVTNAGHTAGSAAYASTGSPASTWPTDVIGNSQWSIYADYTPALVVDPAGIPSASAVGVPAVENLTSAVGIASAAAVGVPQCERAIVPAGIAAGSASGPTISAPVELGTLDQLSAGTHAFTIPAGGVSAGALLVARVLYKNAPNAAATCADSKGNTWTVDAGCFSGNANIFAFSTVVTTPLVAGDTVTVTITGSVGVFFGTYTYWTASAGWQAVWAGQAQTVGSTTGATWTSPSVTTTQPVELLVGLAASSAPTISSTPGAGWTEEIDQAAADFPAERVVAQYQVTSAAGSYAANGSWASGSNTYAALTVGYLPVVAVVSSVGVPTVERDIGVVGIASQAAVGQPVLNRAVALGVPSSSVVGAPAVERLVGAQGIVSHAAVGAPTLNRVSAVGIPSQAAVGVPQCERLVGPGGIASTAAVGKPTLQRVTAQGIGSSSALGQPNVERQIGPAGIASTSAVGKPTLEETVRPVGIPSQAACGIPSVKLTLDPQGIPSRAATGTIVLGRLVQTSGIATLEAFGLPTVIKLTPVLPSAPGRVTVTDTARYETRVMDLVRCGVAFTDQPAFDMGVADFPTFSMRVETAQNGPPGGGGGPTPPPPTDPDSDAFLTAAAITDPTISAAVNTLVVALKTAGLWAKLQAIYPMAGSTAATHKWNLKDPRDLDAAFRITWTGALTHASTGVTPDLTGGDSFGDTHYVPSVSANQNDASLGYYSRSNNVNGSQCDYGAYNSPTTDLRFHLIIRYDGDLFYPGLQDTTDANLPGSTDSRGMFASSRLDGSTVHAYRNGTEFPGSPVADTAGVLCDVPVYIGRLNGFPVGKSQREVAFATIGRGLTGTEQAELYTAVQAFQTALSRNV